MSTPSGASTSNMHASTAIQMNMDYRSAVRFPAWLALAMFSAICLTATCTEVKKKDRGTEEKFVVAVTAISLSVSFLAVLGYLLVRGIFAGTVIEVSMIGFVAAFWGIGLFYIMAPDAGIAVSGQRVDNANLYFFSWLSFAVIIFLVLSYLQEVFGFDARQAPGKQARWFFLFASSLVVLGVASRLHTAESGCKANANTNVWCKRTSYAIGLGVISCAFSIGMSFFIFKGLSAALIETGVTTVLLILWTFGVGFTTFGGQANSPATEIGNLYFSMWISFILTALLFGTALQEYTGMQTSAPTSNQTTTENNNHVGAVPHEDDF